MAPWSTSSGNQLLIGLHGAADLITSVRNTGGKVKSCKVNIINQSHADPVATPGLGPWSQAQPALFPLHSLSGTQNPLRESGWTLQLAAPGPSQRQQGTCPRSHCQEAAELGSEPALDFDNVFCGDAWVTCHSCSLHPVPRATQVGQKQETKPLRNACHEAQTRTRQQVLTLPGWLGTLEAATQPSQLHA